MERIEIAGKWYNLVPDEAMPTAPAKDFEEPVASYELETPCGKFVFSVLSKPDATGKPELWENTQAVTYTKSKGDKEEYWDNGTWLKEVIRTPHRQDSPNALILTDDEYALLRNLLLTAEKYEWI